ncbi:hypothetical protein EV652_101481 [Kribbella steppae]|uniref:Allene oxide cyclase barrel-like domain-containing protein n=1 Tax=Kribbella steppae TaxID=2512223 RepID=A0A4R2HWD6_9ACTN|nr:hypothetical protein [Kribbella steppae]TCO35597.1 hypothetical protein EV652_101481 [Kribbella steppae]
MRSLRIAAFAIATAGAVAGTSLANASPRCDQIDATIYDKVVTEGCPPPSQACVVGTVRGKHGFNGTTVFVLGSRADAPATSPGYRAVSGTFTVTFKDGSTLTALETSIGNVDTATGLGHAGGTQEFTGGTGRYEGATGFTYLNQHFEVDQFVTTIQGEVCRSES